MSNRFPEVPEGQGNLIPAQGEWGGGSGEGAVGRGSGKGSLVYGDREVQTSFMV